MNQCVLRTVVATLAYCSLSAVSIAAFAEAGVKYPTAAELNANQYDGYCYDQTGCFGNYVVDGDSYTMPKATCFAKADAKAYWDTDTGSCVDKK